MPTSLPIWVAIRCWHLQRVPDPTAMGRDTSVILSGNRYPMLAYLTGRDVPRPFEVTDVAGVYVITPRLSCQVSGQEYQPMCLCHYQHLYQQRPMLLPDEQQLAVGVLTALVFAGQCPIPLE